MEIYLDKNFIRNYWGISGEKEVMDSFEKNFLRNLNKCTIICNYQSLEEVMAQEEDSVLFDLILETGSPEIIFLPDMTKEECLESNLTSGDAKLFFVELEEQKIKQLEEEYGYRIISTGNLMEKWSEFIRYELIDKSFAEPPNPEEPDVFNGWEDLKFIKSFPSNSIVLVDKYLLSDKKNSRLKNNLIPLLHNLIPEKFKGELSVVILSQELLKNERKLSDLEKAKKIHQMLNREFAKYKHLTLKFVIVNHDKSFHDKQQPVLHDRYVYTNYFTIKSGSGFDLMDDQKNRKVVDSEMRIEFNFRKYNLKTFPARLEGLNKYLKKMTELDTYQTFKSYPAKFDCRLLSYFGK
jgi:hypothetical protein